MNLRPLGYEPNELPDCSTPRRYEILLYKNTSYSFWMEKDSNLRRRCQQIYSLPPLAAREPILISQFFRCTTQMGLEPTTSAVTGRRSNQLSHWARKPGNLPRPKCRLSYLQNRKRKSINTLRNFRIVEKRLRSSRRSLRCSW